jgi:hypothetical protein
VADIRKQIEENWKTFQNQPQVKDAIKKIDKTKYEAAYRRCVESAAAYVNFESFSSSLLALKARHSTLHPDTEANFAQRADQAVQSYRSFVAAAGDMAQVLKTSGFETGLAQDSKNLFWQLPSSPVAPNLIGVLKGVGITDSQISQYSAELKSNNWELLHLHGGDGTFSGLVKNANAQIPTVEKFAAATKQHGLPAVSGASGDPTPWIVAAIVVGGTICFLVGACELIIGAVAA